VLAFTHANPMIVQCAAQLLQQHGIAYEMRNEFVTSVIGSGAACDAWPELWVSEGEHARTAEVLAAMTLGDDAEPWRCDTCGELNEACFELCWRCQSAGTEELP
jgi:hypothetical protein